ncbi:MAG: hypothetical protein RL483_456 [Pseudomonadota bacterium]
MQSIAEYTQRETLHEEVHARPPIALWPQERVIHQAFLMTGRDQRQVQREWIEALSRVLRQPGHPVHGRSVRVVELSPAPNRLLLKWELHGEFCAVTLYVQTEPVSGPWHESRADIRQRFHGRLAELGVRSLGPDAGERISAVDINIAQRPLCDDAAEIAPLFHGNTIIGGTILGTRKAQVWTDFQIDAGGYIVFLVNHQGMGSRQAGRVVQRLIDVDTYRMMALLALPRAKGLSEPLSSAEADLSALSTQLSEARDETASDPVQTDGRLLTGVSSLAARVEGWVSEHGLRFTASEAYSELVRRALTELKETSLPGVQTLGEFMERRFEPAMRTCRWTQRRLRELSDRISRTTQILRTRIEFINERQTQALLASMDRRAKLQLKLQQTVEGLSLVVLSYYAVGLIGYLAKGLKSAGLSVDADLLTGVSVPLVAGLLFWGIRRARRRAPAGEMPTPHKPQ